MFNPFSLEGKNIIITGASSGIGRQCAIDCSKMGAKIVLIARNKERLEETLSMMEGEGHIVFSFDLMDTQSISSTIDKVVAEIGKLDGLVHAAGIEITKPIKLLKVEDYESIMQSNAFSGFELIKQIGKAKNSNKGASLVLVSSILSVVARGGLAAYAASKGALVSATRVFATELASRSIRVNCVSPGTIMTPMMQSVFESLDEEQKAKRKDGFLLGLGEVTDISNACIYLLSDASRWVTGQNLIVDGGYTIR